MLRTEDCLDVRRSGRSRYSDGTYRWISSPVLHASKISSHVFLVPECGCSVFLSAAFRDAVLAAKLRGLIFDDQGACS